MIPEIERQIKKFVRDRIRLNLLSVDGSEVAELSKALEFFNTHRFYSYRSLQDVRDFWQSLRENQTALDLVVDGHSSLFLYLGGDQDEMARHLTAVANSVTAAILPYQKESKVKPDYVCADEDFIGKITREEWVRYVLYNPWLGYSMMLAFCQIDFKRLIDEAGR